MEERKQYTDTLFITGLRGYSALAVFLVHTNGGGLREFSYITNEIVEKGKYGIISFFIISALTIALSIDRAVLHKRFSFTHYLIIRWFRIFPLFFIVGFYAFLTGGNQAYLDIFNIKNTATNLLIQLSLMNVFFTSHRNNLIGVEWTLPLEFFYYLLFPLFYFSFILIRRKLLMFIFIIIITYVISINSNLILSTIFNIILDNNIGSTPTNTLISNSQYRILADNWGILKYLFTFTSGFIIYFIYKKNIKTLTLLKNNYFIANILFIFICLISLYYILYSEKNLEIIVTLCTCSLILVSFSRIFLVRLLFENSFILYIGKISYSFYLLHFLVIKQIKLESAFLSVIFALIVTILLSTITYYVIEKPFITLGRNFTK